MTSKHLGTNFVHRSGGWWGFGGFGTQKAHVSCFGGFNMGICREDYNFKLRLAMIGE